MADSKRKNIGMGNKNSERVTRNIAIGIFFNRDLNRGCLVYMFFSDFSESKFLINLRRQFRVRKIFQFLARFAVFSFCVRKCVTHVLGCFRSLTKQVFNKRFCSSQWNSI